MQYSSVKETAARWQITERRVQDMCRSHQIRGAVRWGRGWMIPGDAERPHDRRRKAYRQETVLPRRLPLMMAMTSFFSEPGSAETCLESLKDNPISALLFEAQISYFRGDILQAERLAHRVIAIASNHQGQAGAGLLLALCGIHRGNLSLYREGKHYLVSAPCRSDTELEELALWRAGLESEVLDVDGFPSWLKIGNLSPLPIDTHPAARFFYMKYLFVIAHERLKASDNRLDITELMRVIPLVGEPLVSQTELDGTFLCEIYQRLMCAVGYHSAGKDDMAIVHIDRAIALATPDRLWQPLVETRRLLDYLLDDRLELASPEILREVRRLHKEYGNGWVSLQNLLLSRKIHHRLTIREREVSRLAVYGLSNKEIAQWLHLSVNAVKQTLRTAMDKTGAEKRADLGEYI